MDKIVYKMEYLPIDKRSNGHIPSRVSGHAKAKKRPKTIVMERGDEHSCSTACSEYVCPCAFVQMVIDIVYVTVIIFPIFKQVSAKNFVPP